MGMPLVHFSFLPGTQNLCVPSNQTKTTLGHGGKAGMKEPVSLNDSMEESFLPTWNSDCSEREK